MDDEPNLVDFYNVLNKRKKTIIGLTLAIVLITLIILIMVPKTYESESMIGMARLGQINQDGSTLDNFIIKPNEAEKLIKSSLILQPVIDKFIFFIIL